RTIDEKNRIAIPAKLRDSLGSKFYITIGLDDVVDLRSEETFMTFSNKLIAQSQFSKHIPQSSTIHHYYTLLRFYWNNKNA
ncbi:MraZ N-terminal domain-containing protein, partial [Mycoplasmopsis bovis]|uniref:MraZ N-terminal domain-containing protein n=1 Tax=Mycoplasmopsis bovis TaxID=28903 RepID=UPI003D292B14